MRKQILSNLARHMIPSVGTIVVVALILLAYRAWAMPPAMPSNASGLPGMINYQGHLTNPLGYPVNENVDITFTLYDALTDGMTLWSEVHTAVPVSTGLFHVMLGSVTPIPNTVWSADRLYMGVQIGNDPEMTPREPVGMVPYALHALRATGLSAFDGDPADAVAVDDAGNVGIGTTSPRFPLHVNGDYYGRGHVWLYAYEGDGLDGSAYIQARDGSGTTDLNLVLRAQNAGQYVDSMILKADGNVGVGTWNPQAKLDVNGDSHIRGNLTVDGDITNLIRSQTYSFNPASGTKDLQMTPSGNSVCFLTGVQHNTFNAGYEHISCYVTAQGDGFWHLTGESQPPGYAASDVVCQANCLSW